METEVRTAKMDLIKGYAVYFGARGSVVVKVLCYRSEDERAPHRNKIANFRQQHSDRNDRKSHKGSRYQDILTD
jgi:putative component of toxin-antitoxin plasmid stabilization module